ncbi:MAG TPA: glycosyltransferase family 4 protein [Anaerolineales bacterium]
MKIILAANTDWYLYNFRASLAHFLRDEGFEVVLVSPPGKYLPVFEQWGFRWLPWRLGRQTLGPWNEVPSFLELARIYRQEKPDLVHHHTIKPVLYGSLTARLLGMPAVVNSITGRGYIFLAKENKARLLRPVAKNLYRLAFGHPNYAAVFENETDRQYFIREKIVPAGRTWITAGVGVDPQRFTPTPPPAEPVVVLFSGRLLWDKGVGVLVEAARSLHKQAARRGATVRVALAGEPDPGNPASISPDTLQGWVQEGVIEYWGWQSEMSQAYARCHIVAAPTMYGEGVPTVLLEAAACGRPIVATDMPGCRDIVLPGQNGLIVPPNDAPALADALEALICDPDLRGRMGAIGRQTVLQKFTTAQVNTATLAVYRKVLGHSAIPETEVTQL